MPDTDTIAEPEVPASEKPPEPQVAAKRLTAGEGVTELLEASGMELASEEKAKLLEITEDKAMAAFLEANLGDGMNPNELKARSIFSSWMFKQIVLPPMLLTLHMDNLKQAELAIKEVKRVLADGKGVEGASMTHEERNGYYKTLSFLIHDRGAILLKNALNLALLVQGEPDKKNTGKAPRNRPPDSLSQTNVAVQVNLDRERKPGDNQKEVEADILRKLKP